MDAASELLKLAEKKFGKLTAAEKKLFRAAAEGEIADYSPRSKKPIDPANAAKWGPTRVLRAGRIAWLCTDRQAAQLVTHRGIHVKGARIDEKLDLEDAKVSFPLRFELCKFTDLVIFAYAQIAALYMPGTHTGPLRADALKVGGSVFLRDGFKAEGEVYLPGATVGGDFDCSNAQFINKRARALSGDRLKVGGGVFLRDGFKAGGEVRLPGATVGGDLTCTNGKFINQGGAALSADGLSVAGYVYLRDGFEARGTVSLVGATIGQKFCLTGVGSPKQMTLDLGFAKIGTLYDERESWPGPGRLSLHCLEYEGISQKSPRDSETRIEWLRRQKGFSPQPYEQLAKVLRESGDGAGARDVLVAKNRDKAERTKLTFPEKCWYHVLGRPIGYGHKPWLAIPWALAFILVGWILFAAGSWCGLITPPSESAYVGDNAGTRQISKAYPAFNSLAYSIDVFVPVVDLRQAKYWLPNANCGREIIAPTSSQVFCTGGLLLFWLWFETALGWILTTLLLVGLTGLVRT